MTTRDFTSAFCGRRGFGFESGKNIREEWSKMTDAEKLEFMNKKMDMMNKMFSEDGQLNHKGLVAMMDARCEEWMKKSPEEKEAMIKEREEAMHMHGRDFGQHREFFGHRGGFGFH